MVGTGLSGHSLSQNGEFRYSQKDLLHGVLELETSPQQDRKLGDSVTCHAPHIGDVEETSQSGWGRQSLS